MQFLQFFLSNCHYAGETLETLTENNIFFVPKHKNLPSCQKMRPIESSFGILKQYMMEIGLLIQENNSFEGLKITDMDMDIVIRMLDRLEGKIQQAMIMDQIVYCNQKLIIVTKNFNSSQKIHRNSPVNTECPIFFTQTLLAPIQKGEQFCFFDSLDHQ